VHESRLGSIRARRGSRTSSVSSGSFAQEEDPCDDHPATERKDGKSFHAAEIASRSAAREQQRGVRVGSMTLRLVQIAMDARDDSAVGRFWRRRSAGVFPARNPA
jgi:hypothetical protein